MMWEYIVFFQLLPFQDFDGFIRQKHATAFRTGELFMKRTGFENKFCSVFWTKKREVSSRLGVRMFASEMCHIKIVEVG